MTTIVTRAGKGSPLTNTEMDTNLTNLNTYKCETANNLSDLTNTATARTNLGLAIGTNVQGYDADIATVAASQAEMEAGTETALRSMSPLRVKQAINASPSVVFATAAENIAGTVEGKAVDPLGIREAFNCTGSAPVYACRAWVNFNGTGTVAIRASGNVSSITDNGTGDYTVNFTNAMPDANYGAQGITGTSAGNNGYMRYNGALSASSFRTGCLNNVATAYLDCEYVWMSFFR